MTHRGLACLLLLGACFSNRWLVVQVRAGDGAPLAGATVSAVCEPLGSSARRTAGDGVAALEIRADPERCVITAAHEDHATRQTRVTVLCRERAGCAPLALALERE